MKKILLAATSSFAVLAIAHAAAAAGNESTVTQVGNNNSTGVIQSGDQNYVNLYQPGNNNQFYVQQNGNNNFVGTDYFLPGDPRNNLGQRGTGAAGQFGNNNYASVTQQGDSNTVFMVPTVGAPGNSNSTQQFRQYGSNNLEFAGILGNGNKQDFTQYGSGNQAFSVVSGTGDSITYVQSSPGNTPAGQGNLIGSVGGTKYSWDSNVAGNHDTVYVNQQGANQVLYQVLGNNDQLAISQNNWQASGAGLYATRNIADVNIQGNSDVVSISQTGGNNTFSLDIQGSSNVTGTVQNGASNTASVMQTGTNNQAFTAQYGASNASSIIQSGTGNIASVTQIH